MFRCTCYENSVFDRGLERKITQQYLLLLVASNGFATVVLKNKNVLYNLGVSVHLIAWRV